MIARLKKTLRQSSLALKAILVLSGLAYAYLSILPKHHDFLQISFISRSFALYGLDFVNEVIPKYVAGMYPPTYYVFQGLWIRLGAAIFHYDLGRWTYDSSASTSLATVPSVFPFWGMVPNLACLFLFAGTAYLTLKNKWLSLLVFGTLTFISVAVLGQIDLFTAFFIYLSMYVLLRASGSGRYLPLIILSFLLLGVSTQFKIYSGILLPVYGIYALAILRGRKVPGLKAYAAVAVAGLAFIAMFIAPWIPFLKWFGTTSMIGESNWALSLQVSPLGLPPYHNIAIWLLGYAILLYAFFRDALRADKAPGDGRRFIFYSFAVTAWFFVAVYTHPSWWIFLLSPILFVMDNFKSRLNYVFCLAFMTLYVFFTMMWVNNTIYVLRCYMPVFLVTGDYATILITAILALLVVWAMEAREELRATGPEAGPAPRGGPPRSDRALALAALVGPFLIVFLVVCAFIFVAGMVGPYNLQADRSMGGIYGNNTVGQTFFSPYNGLLEVETILNVSYDHYDAGDIIFHLRDASSPEDLVTAKIDADDLIKGPPVAVFFPPIADSKDKLYLFYFESPNSTPGNAPAIYSSARDYYPGGTAYVDQEPVNGDLVFKTHYKPGLDSFLPFLDSSPTIDGDIPGPAAGGPVP